MNRKQKMILKMWKNYKHNCDTQNEKPMYNYKTFKWAYSVENYNYIYEEKEWYKYNRIN